MRSGRSWQGNRDAADGKAGAITSNQRLQLFAAHSRGCGGGFDIEGVEAVQDVPAADMPPITRYSERRVHRAIGAGHAVDFERDRDIETARVPAAFVTGLDNQPS